jgi:4-amino-4-deoxy-L-arabinose transferase-like glycosyltransferase
LVSRLPAIFCGVVSSLLIFRIAEKISHTERGARWSTIALNASFLPVALWIMFLPDTILFVLTLWLVIIILNILDKNKFQHWVQLGFCLGLCGLSKYTSVFLLVSLLGIVYSEKFWTKIKFRDLFISASIAIILVIPVFYWNFKHDWISFSYQQSHVMRNGHFNILNLFSFFAVQLVAFSPFVILPSAYWIWRTFHSWEREARVALWIAAPSLLFFAGTSLKDEVLPHWTILGWGLIIPAGIALGMRENPCRKTKISVVISIFLLLFALSEFSFQFLKLPPYQSPYADLMGWPQLHNEVQKILEKEKPNSYSIGVPNWTLGSRANYYLEDLAKIFVLDNRFDQFDLWEGGPPKTENVLIIEWRGFNLGTKELSECSKMEFVKEITFEVNGSPVNSAKISWCRGFKVVSPESTLCDPAVSTCQ